MVRLNGAGKFDSFPVRRRGRTLKAPWTILSHVTNQVTMVTNQDLVSRPVTTMHSTDISTAGILVVLSPVSRSHQGTGFLFP